jgi:hypothetical protein
MKGLGVAIIGLLGIFGFIFAVAFCFAFPTMWLWDWLMPTLFGLKTITIWQAFGINMLSSILFKSNTYNQEKER